MEIKELIGKKVSVHFNLHTKLWSVKHKGKVVQNLEHLTIRPTKFHINENGRQRVIKKKMQRSSRMDKWNIS